jgi:hypothetical protein
MPAPYEKVTLKVGTYSLSQDGSDSEELEIMQVIRHPDWAQIAEGFSNDFLLFKLAGKANLHHVIKINRDPTIPVNRQEVIMMGLGWTNTTFASPAVTLQVASMNALSNVKCARSSDPARNKTYSDLVDETMLCTTGGPSNERDGWYVVSAVSVIGEFHLVPDIT